MKTLSSIATLVALSLILISCGSDDSDSPSIIDLNDKDAVSNSLTIQGATKVEGAPPAPSTDPNAPALKDDSNDFAKFIQGTGVILDLDLTAGAASGIYFQVQGADSYYDIPASAFASAGGRLMKNSRTAEDNPAFVLEIPSNIQPGPLCVEYCVYDAESRVSNIVTRCIEIEELGGANSEFLTDNAWSVVSFTDVYDGMTFTELVGETYSETNETEVFCSTTQDFVVVTATWASRTDYLYITLTSNGGVQVEESYYEKYPDYDNADCSLPHIEGTEVETFDGGWSYDDTTKTLTLILNFEEEGEVETEFYDFIVSQSGNGYSWTFTFEDETFILNVVPKQ